MNSFKLNTQYYDWGIDASKTEFDLNDSKIIVTFALICKKDKCQNIVGDFVKLFKQADLPKDKYDLQILCKSNDVREFRYLWETGVLQDTECCYLLTNREKERIVLFKNQKEYKEEIKMKYSQLKQAMREFNTKHGITRKVEEKKKDDGTLICMRGKVVIKSSVLRQDMTFTEAQRTYEFTNYNKALTSDDLGYSIFAHCKEDDDCMRIENYRDEDIESAEIIETVEEEEE